MAGEIHRLRERQSESEKMTINVGFVDLGHIDLLVREGFYSNRTDFIRTAIRNQLASHADAVKQSIVRHTLELGLRRVSHQELEASKAKGIRLQIQVVGLATIGDDVTPELARETIESITVLGAFTPAKRSSLRSPTVSSDRRSIRRLPPETLINRDPTMGTDFGAAMRQALQLVRSKNVSEATRVIQRALVDRVGDASPVDNPRERGLIPPPSSEIIGTADAVKPAPRPAQERAASAKEAATRRQP
jgi:Arc/MetJ-type ribon-helix-helix transcriptional regulator